MNFGGAAALGGAFVALGNGTTGYSMGVGTQGNTNPGAYNQAGVNFVSLYQYESWNFPASPVDIPTTGWHHCVIVIGSNKQTTYYLDGVQVGTNSNSTIVTPSGNSFMATDSINSGRYYGGLLCNCAVYNYVLSPTRIQAHYNAGIG